MTVPMMLPWLARKWGVSDQRALELWRLACREAAAAGREPCSSQYWGHAKDCLIDLLDDEVLASYPVLETPWIMIQLNLLRLWASARFWLEYRRSGSFA